MRVKASSYTGPDYEYANISDFAEDALDGSDYGYGELETLKATARNNSRAIGHLLDVLADKNLLDNEEVSRVLDNFCEFLHGDPES